MKYVFILYSYYSKSILSDPLKSRTRKDIIQSCTTCHEYLEYRGFIPKIYWFDNESYNALNQGVEVQLVTIGYTEEIEQKEQSKLGKITSLQNFAA